MSSIKIEAQQNNLLIKMKVIKLHTEEQQLIEHALQNNRHAQHQLYNTYAAKMLGVCRNYIKDIHEAEDVMISSFMKVFTHLAAFENKGSFEGWIRRIMINECLSYLRVKKKVNFIEDQTQNEFSYQEHELQFTAEELQALIDKLPEGYKMVFNLYVVEGYKHHEIAELLHISEGTSKSQLSHARKYLQELIEKTINYQNGTK